MIKIINNTLILVLLQILYQNTCKMKELLNNYFIHLIRNNNPWDNIHDYEYLLDHNKDQQCHYINHPIMGKKKFKNGILYLTFGYHFNEEIHKDDIPSSITYLDFGYLFNQKLDKEVIPNNVIHLIFSHYFDQKLKKGVIPNSVKYLTFGNHFNQPLRINDIPKGVTHLTFGKNFNKIIGRNVIPDSVTHLTFGTDFNQILEIGVIPNSVTHLTFGDNFNQILNIGVIPDSVTHLIFGDNFNQKLNIPNSIGFLILGRYYNQALDELTKNMYFLLVDDKYKYENLENSVFFVCYRTTIYEIFDEIIPHHYISFYINDYMYNLDDYKFKILLNVLDKILSKKSLFIGEIIFQELTEKIFNPRRLIRLCNEYNISITDIDELY